MGTYHGGKVKIGEKVANAILDLMLDSNKQYKGYCEPFCGFCGVYRHIPDMFEEEFERDFTYLAGDGNGSVIKMWKGLQGRWNPPLSCNKKRFEELKYNGRESAEKGLVGHACGFRGIYFAKFDDRIKLEKVSDLFKDLAKDELLQVEFMPGSYTQFTNLKGFVIYCDPPYDSGSRFYDKDNKKKTFDKEAFIDWCKMMKKKGNLVIISEHSGTLPFTEIVILGNESIYVV